MLLAPPNRQVWYKAFLWWVRVQGRSPRASSRFQKCPRSRRHSPFGAPQASDNKPNPPEGGKSLGGAWDRRILTRNACQEANHCLNSRLEAEFLLFRNNFKKWHQRSTAVVIQQEYSFWPKNSIHKYCGKKLKLISSGWQP